MSKESPAVVDHDLPATQRVHVSLGVLREAIRWQPCPLEKPTVHEDLPHMSHVERSAEALRYQMLRLEFALSPDGGMREWLKLVLRMAIVAGAPCLLIVPIVTYFLSGFAAWTSFLRAAAINLVVTVAALIALVLLLMIFASILGAAVRRRR
jgi:hypothetical protein